MVLWKMARTKRASGTHNQMSWCEQTWNSQSNELMWAKMKLCFRIQARWLDEMSWISIGYRSAKMLKVADGRSVQRVVAQPPNSLVQPATGNTARGRGAVAASRDAVQFIWRYHESRVAMSGAKALAAAASLTQCATASFAFQVQGHQSARQLFQDCGRHCCRGVCPSIDTLPKTCHS